MDNSAHYRYDGLELWTPSAWADRFSPITPLARWIGDVGERTVRRDARLGRFEGRRDGVYTAKTHANTYPDVVDGWRRRGVTHVQDEMGQATWTALIPDAALRPGAGAQRLFLILHNADYSDPNWAMDALEYYDDQLDALTSSGWVALIVAPDGVDESFIYINIVQELAVRFHLELSRVMLDVSAVERIGARLADVPGFTYVDEAGAPVDDPDAAIEHVGSTPALDITGRWQNRVSAIYQNATAARYQHRDVHLEHIIHSEAGKQMAAGMRWEHEYSSVEDDGLRAELAQAGVRCATHRTAGEQWVSLVPLAAEAPGAAPLPLVLVFQEATALNPFQAVSALSAYRGYVELVAQGELIVAFFALETPDDNDLGVEIIDAAAGKYPVDLSRVYVTGHSHNGHFSMEFARRHPDRITAVASLGNAYGLPAPEYSHEAVKVTDEKVEAMAAMDMPVIDICGYVESDFVRSDVGTPDFDNAVDSWRRRALATGLPQLAAERIAGAKTSPDRVARALGLPPDRSDIQYRMGAECYVGDFDSIDGRLRLRLVALEHFPHMIAPQMPELSWDFLRRFRRDVATGEISQI